MGLWETAVRFNSAIISILESWPTINILTIALTIVTATIHVYIQPRRTLTRIFQNLLNFYTDRAIFPSRSILSFNYLNQRLFFFSFFFLL